VSLVGCRSARLVRAAARRHDAEIVTVRPFARRSSASLRIANWLQAAQELHWPCIRGAIRSCPDVRGLKVPARTLHCYAEESEGDWEAICLDLDIAVQGRSFEEVFGSLREAIRLYLETVSDLPFEERHALLHRPAPFPVRFRFLARALRGLLASPNGGQWHQFTMPLAA
jgi:predicted RNase H-like HicB family nuclease